VDIRERIRINGEPITQAALTRLINKAAVHIEQMGDKKPTFFTFVNDVKDGRVKPAGEWNTLEMTARGKTLTLWVNGAVTCQFRDCGREKGRVGLEGEGFLIEFRNLKGKELR
jgi:hypothetical protein